MTHTKSAGLLLIVLAISFNAIFLALGATFDYPNVLRRPPDEVLSQFAAGGLPLLLLWTGFMFSAALLVPLSGWLYGVLKERGLDTPGAFACGVTAGVLQAVGLARWVFVIPGVAADQPDPEVFKVFHAVHQYGGVAIGEQLGQFFTALWILQIGRAQSRGGLPFAWLWPIAIVAGLLILVGLTESYSTVLTFDPGWLGLAAPLGFVLLSVWMGATGLGLVLNTQSPLNR